MTFDETVHAIRMETESENVPGFDPDKLFEANPGSPNAVAATVRYRDHVHRAEGRSREAAALALLDRLRQWKMDRGLPFRSGLQGLDGDTMASGSGTGGGAGGEKR